MTENRKSKYIGKIYDAVNKCTYPLAVIGIVGIFVFHLLFQYFYIQDNKRQSMDDLVRSDQIEAIDTEPESLPRIISVKEENPEKKEVFDKKSVKSTTIKRTKPVRSNKRAVRKTLERKVRSKKRKPINKNIPPKETRAKRLRRAEKILTGV